MSAYIERREATGFKDSDGKMIRRWDWIRYVYYDRGRGTCTVAGGEGPVFRGPDGWTIVQITPYEIILTPLSGIVASTKIGDTDHWIEGWIDVPDCPRQPWEHLKHTGDRPNGSERD